MPIADTSLDVASPAELAPEFTGHRISALYPHLLAANAAQASLLVSGFTQDAIEIRQRPMGGATGDAALVDSSDEVIKEIVVDGAIGAAIGVGIGAISTVALIASSVTLFIASPIIAPIALMANLATVGGLLGGAYGAEDKQTHFSTLVAEALAMGNVLLLVKTRSEHQNNLAKQIISASLTGIEPLINESDYPPPLY